MTAGTAHPTRTVAWAVFAALIALAHGGSLRNSFAIDDGALLLDNPAVHGLTTANLAAIFSGVPNGMEYLPIRDLSYMLDFQLWRLRPVGFHLTNLMLFLAVCAAAYGLFVRILGHAGVPSRWPAFAAVVFYAVHPVNVEVVASIAQRKDLLAALFLVLSVSAYLAFRERGGQARYALALGAFAAALLSKPTAVGLPLVLAVVEWLVLDAQPDSRRRRLASILPFVVIAAALSAIQLAVLHRSHLLLWPPRAEEYLARWIGAFPALLFYLRLWAWPQPLTILHDHSRVRMVTEPAVLLGLAAAVLLGWCVWWLRRRARGEAFAIAWSAATILPVLGLVPVATVVAERYLFVPALGLCLGLGLAGWRAVRWRVPPKLAATALVAAVALSGAASAARTRDWRDALTLYRAGLRVTPESPRLHWLAGRELFASGRFEEAFREFDAARRISPPYGIDYQVFTALRQHLAGDHMSALRTLAEIPLPAWISVQDIHYLSACALAASHRRTEAKWHLDQALASRIRLGVFGPARPARALKAFEAGTFDGRRP